MPDAPERETALNWVAHARTRLALRRAEKPATKAGQIRALWPEIAAALEGGQSVKSIRQWLEEDAGIVVGVTSLTSYISRIRRRESATQRARSFLPPEAAAVDRSSAPGEQTIPASANNAPGVEPRLNVDPIAQAMRALSKPRLDIRKLHGDGDPRGKGLI